MTTNDTNDGQPKIQLGDYIILQRQKYTKLVKFSSISAIAALGKEQLELGNILDKPYFSTFKMCPKEDLGKSHRGRQRLHTLEICTDVELPNIREAVSREALGISSSGIDNRNIIDDGDSQSLKSDDIEQLRDEYNKSTKIIEKIVENSKTFHTKTEYSQEKYLKKKEKKYFEFVQIKQPNIRLIAEIYYRQDAEKIMSIRMDTLSQIISYSGVSAYGNYLMYESGTNGLLPAAFLNAIGSNTEACLVHMHPGNVPQQQALLALNFPEEQGRRCISVNIYSVLRDYYQGEDSKEDENADCNEHLEPCIKRPKLQSEIEKEENQKEENAGEQTNSVNNVVEEISATQNQKEENAGQKTNSLNNVEEIPATRTKSDSDECKQIQETAIVNNDCLMKPLNKAHVHQKWQLENRRACLLMREKFDSLFIAAKEHPTNLVRELLHFIKPSRPIVIFSLCREVLTELYVDLKTNNSKVINLHLTSNWMRMYQILPNRTHPEVNMQTNSGFLLTGFTVE
uniref:tRNA (adenine(58)-N(1))-methyltransferase non-catalytic subunit TRM6 n=1 Tax=Glossina palpalis gambiensis TaxID=67801 RepID=A0A1B0C0F4_9MUSC